MERQSPPLSVCNLSLSAHPHCCLATASKWNQLLCCASVMQWGARCMTQTTHLSRKNSIWVHAHTHTRSYTHTHTHTHTHHHHHHHHHHHTTPHTHGNTKLDWDFFLSFFSSFLHYLFVSLFCLWQPVGVGGEAALPGALDSAHPTLVPRYLEGQAAVTIQHVACGDLFTACLTGESAFFTLWFCSLNLALKWFWIRLPSLWNHYF